MGFTLENMLPFLRDKNIAGLIQICGVLESTNTKAKEAARAGAQHGTVIIAEAQTAGRGRYGRTFYSPQGHGIYMSAILRPERLWFEAGNFTITAFAAVAACEAIEAVSETKPRIKRINDIYLNGKKICGILAEAAAGAGSKAPQWLVVGIGLNFDTPAASFPADIRQTAGALFPDGAPPVTRERLAAEIVNRLVSPEKHYTEEEILEQYESRLMS